MLAVAPLKRIPPGNLLQEVDSEGSRSPGSRPQARKCLERREVARRIARATKLGVSRGTTMDGGFPAVLRVCRSRPYLSSWL